eukprot:117515-Chlamydomonas_euryale.AAC.5
MPVHYAWVHAFVRPRLVPLPLLLCPSLRQAVPRTSRPSAPLPAPGCPPNVSSLGVPPCARLSPERLIPRRPSLRQAVA